jgi:putative membrane protein
MEKIMKILELIPSCVLAIAILIFPAGTRAHATDLSTETTFVQKIAMDEMFEIEASKIAVDKGASQKVKHLAVTIMQDSSKSNDTLKSIAAAKGIDLPKQLSPADQEMIDKLNALGGMAFDLAYLDDMATVHTSDHALFVQEANSSSDTGLKSFAGKSDEMDKERMATLQDLQSKLEK